MGYGIRTQRLPEVARACTIQRVFMELKKTPEKSSVRDYFDALSIELHLSVAQTVGLEPTTLESLK